MDWQEILLGEESWPFLGEIVLRTAIMLVLLFVGLRFTGKRGIKQLSVFELLIIIALGSAAGDPMIYREVGIAFALIAFFVVFGGYKLITYFIMRSEKAEDILEGKPFCIIYEGRASEESLRHHELAMDEFFSELRNKHIFQLGQIEVGILETSGELSLLLYNEEDVRPGLPLWPNMLNTKSETAPSDGLYVCTYCGNTQTLAAGERRECPFCKQNNMWMKATAESRPL